MSNGSEEAKKLRTLRTALKALASITVHIEVVEPSISVHVGDALTKEPGPS